MLRSLVGSEMCIRDRSNNDQSNIDSDDFGDLCDPDMDNDSFANEMDNCPRIPNRDQNDTDDDSIGNICDIDIDGDGIENAFDLRELDSSIAGLQFLTVNTTGYPESTFYSGEGKKVLVEIDTLGDGQINRRDVYKYDDNGNNTLIEKDIIGDGEINVREFNEYDENGNLILIEFDNNADGEINARSTYVYNESGDVILFESDSDFDGLDNGTINIRLSLIHI